MLWALWCTLSVTLIHCRQRTRSWFNDWGLLQSVFLAVLSCASWFFWPELRPCNPRCIPCITKPVSYSFALHVMLYVWGWDFFMRFKGWGERCTLLMRSHIESLHFSRCRHVFTCVQREQRTWQKRTVNKVYNIGKTSTFAAVTEMLRRVSPFKSHGCSELSGRPVPRHGFHNRCHSFQNMLQKHTLDARFNASMLQCPFAILFLVDCGFEMLELVASANHAHRQVFLFWGFCSGHNAMVQKWAMHWKSWNLKRQAIELAILKSAWKKARNVRTIKKYSEWSGGSTKVSERIFKNMHWNAFFQYYTIYIYIYITKASR